MAKHSKPSRMHRRLRRKIASALLASIDNPTERESVAYCVMAYVDEYIDEMRARMDGLITSKEAALQGIRNAKERKKNTEEHERHRRERRILKWYAKGS